MSYIYKFFFASPKEVGVQELSAEEIVSFMKKREEQEALLPYKFGRKVDMLLRKKEVI